MHTSLHENNSSWEHIVVVDGPTKSTIPTFLLSCPHVVIIELPVNVGQACAANIGLSHAKAPYVTFLDDDDFLFPYGLDKRLEAIRVEKVKWSAAPLMDFREDGGGIVFSKTSWQGLLNEGINRKGELLERWTNVEDTPLSHTLFVVDRKLTIALGGLSGLGQGEGIGFAIALTAVSDGMVTPEPLYAYRQHSGSVTASGDFEVMERYVKVAAKIRGEVLSNQPLESTY